MQAKKQMHSVEIYLSLALLNMLIKSLKVFSNEKGDGGGNNLPYILKTHVPIISPSFFQETDIQQCYHWA